MLFKSLFVATAAFSSIVSAAPTAPALDVRQAPPTLESALGSVGGVLDEILGGLGTGLGGLGGRSLDDLELARREVAAAVEKRAFDDAFEKRDVDFEKRQDLAPTLEAALGSLGGVVDEILAGLGSGL